MTKEELLALDRAHVVYPWVVQGKGQPILMDRADGIYMWDIDGKRYIDFCGGLLNINIGHGNRHVLEAMKRQMDRLCFVGTMFATEPKARLAALVAEVTPGDLDHVFFTNAGADAVENAIKAARWYTGRNKILAGWTSYHGATAGGITLTGDPRRWVCEPGIPGVNHFFGPYCYRCPYGYPDSESCGIQCLETLKSQIMYEGPKTIAAIFMEPIVGTNGIIVPPVEFMKGVRQLCDENGSLLVSDEVMAGWGRSGTWFGVDHFGIVPDMMTMAKGITSGYIQLGALVWNRKIHEHFCERPFMSGLTYQGHALACSAGVASVDVYRQENLVEKSRVNGEYLYGKLVQLKEAHPSVGDVRCKGLWACIELTANREKKTPLAGYADCRRNVSAELTKRLYSMGLYLFAKWDFIFIAPPLIITRDQIDEAVEIVGRALEYTDSLVER